VKSRRVELGQHRTVHFIDKVTESGRMQYGYRFGVVPEG
jgi:hypothetical protein